MHMASLLDRPPKLAGKHVLSVEDKPLVPLQAEDELRDAGATVLGPAVCVDQALRLIGMAVADGGIGAAVLDINLDGRHVRPVAERLAALGGAPPCSPRATATAATRAGLPFAVGARLLLDDGARHLVRPTDRASYGRLTRLFPLGRARDRYIGSPVLFMR